RRDRLIGEQVLGRLSDLPVAVFEGGVEGGVHLGTVEGGEGENGAAADGGLVAAGGEDGGGAGGGGGGGAGGERGAAGGGGGGGGAGEGVVVPADEGAQRGDGAGTDGGRAELTECPRRRLDHGDVVVGEESEQRAGRGVEDGREVGGPPADPGRGIGEGGAPC